MKKLIALSSLFALSTAAQAQWIQQVSGTQGDLQSIYFTAPNKGHIAYYLGSYGGTLRTTDGATWTDQLLSFAPFHSVHFANNDTGLLAGGYGTVMKTTDGGATWNNSNVTSPGNTWIADIFYSAPGTCIAGCINGELYKTTDGGNTWSSQVLNMGIVSIYFTSSSTGYAAGTDNTFAYAGTIAKTTDGGATWGYYYVPKNNTQLRSIHFPSASVGYAAGETTVLKTTDAGATWTMLNVDSTLYYSDVFFADNNIGYITTETGMIFKTIDGGAIWISQVSGTTKSLNSIWCTDMNTCYAVGDSGVILKTTNGGVGLNELPVGYSNINAYPNPFSDRTVIETNDVINDNTKLRLFDVSGREINAATEIDGSRIILSSNDLSAGMYFFTVHEGNILKSTGKLLVE